MFWLKHDTPRLLDADISLQDAKVPAEARVELAVSFPGVDLLPDRTANRVPDPIKGTPLQPPGAFTVHLIFAMQLKQISDSDCGPSGLSKRQRACWVPENLQQIAFRSGRVSLCTKVFAVCAVPEAIIVRPSCPAEEEGLDGCRGPRRAAGVLARAPPTSSKAG